MSQQRSIAPAAFLLAALLAAGWSASTWSAARRDAVESARDLRECQRLRDQIVAARAAPSVASERELRPADVSRALNDALRKADIEPDQLVRVAPASPKRSTANSAYEERPTQLQLRDLTLKQIVRFIDELAGEPRSDGSASLGTRSIRLSAADASAKDGDWSADVLIGYWIYAPRTTSSPRASDQP